MERELGERNAPALFIADVDAEARELPGLCPIVDRTRAVEVDVHILVEGRRTRLEELGGDREQRVGPARVAPPRFDAALRRLSHARGELGLVAVVESETDIDAMTVIEPFQGLTGKLGDRNDDPVVARVAEPNAFDRLKLDLGRALVGARAGRPRSGAARRGRLKASFRARLVQRVLGARPLRSPRLSRPPRTRRARRRRSRLPSPGPPPPGRRRSRAEALREASGGE